MGDHTGGGGRVSTARNPRGRRNRTGPETQTGFVRNGAGRAVSGSAAIANRQLALRHADWLNDARNPGRQSVLATQSAGNGRNRAQDARDRVAGYRAGFTSGRLANSGSVAFRTGERAALTDLRTF